MAVDEDSEIVIHDRPVPPALSESGEGKTGRAKDLADLWWDINLSDVDGDNDNDNTAKGKKNGGLSGDLSPLTVAAPIHPRRASNPEALATAANTALAGHNNLSPLTVRAPDAPRRHSGDFDSKDSAKMGERAPWDLGGECFMLAREEADGGQGEGLGREEGGREDGRVAFPVSSPPYGFDSETRAQLGESSEAHPHSRISSSGIVEMAVEPLNEVGGRQKLRLQCLQGCVFVEYRYMCEFLRTCAPPFGRGTTEHWHMLVSLFTYLRVLFILSWDLCAGQARR